REEWMAAWLPHVLWAPRFVSLPSTPLTPDFTLIKDTSELAREEAIAFASKLAPTLPAFNPSADAAASISTADPESA
ncbi:hypothetical protein CXB37_27480, partial [Pseudomonas syringae pv. syringae]